MAENINQGIADLVASLNDLIAANEDCCRSSFREIGPDDGLGGEDAPVGEGKQFETQEDYQTAKCQTANAIYDGLKSLVDWLDANNVDLLAGVFGGITSGLVVAFMLAGPVGILVAALAGTITTIAGFVVAYSINFEDMQDAMTEVHEELVTALFQSSTAEIAREAFLTALDEAPTTITSIERDLMEVLLITPLLNQLFSPNPRFASYNSPDPITCTAVLNDMCPIGVVYGTGVIDYSGAAFTLTAEDVGPYFSINLQSPDTCLANPSTPKNWCVEFNSTTITNPEGTFQRAIWCRDSSYGLFLSDYNGAFPNLVEPYPMASLELNSATTFTVTMQVNGKAGACVQDPESDQGCDG